MIKNDEAKAESYKLYGRRQEDPERMIIRSKADGAPGIRYNSVCSTDGTFDIKGPRSVVFPFRTEAYQVLDELNNDIKYFKRTSMERFYQLCHLPVSKDDQKMGWDKKAFSEVKVERVYAGYSITFPEPMPIEPLPSI